MTDLGVAELQAIEPPPLATPIAAPNPLLDGPLLFTLLRLTAPNIVALSVGMCVAIAETSYIGRLGIEPLAAMALVFPFVILTMTMSGGAMGGGVASAIARALGAGDVERASVLAIHAIMIGACFGLTFTVGMLTFGPYLLEKLGGRGRVLSEAVGYVEIFFGGAIVPWLMNTLTSILRGTGNMKLPSALILLSATIQIVLGGALGLGFGPIPQFGMRGVACGTLIAFATGSTISCWYLFSGRGRLNLATAPFRFRREMFFDILKVGAVACFSPLQSVLAITIWMVVVLAGVVEERRILAERPLHNLFERFVLEFGAFQQIIAVVDIGQVMLVVVKLQRFLRHVGLECIVCVRQIGKFEGHGIVRGKGRQSFNTEPL